MVKNLYLHAQRCSRLAHGGGKYPVMFLHFLTVELVDYRPTMARWTSSCALRRRIVVAMSGGVDSSVAAYLLQQSHPQSEILALHMSNWDAADEDETSTVCVQSEKDASDAQDVSDALGITMHRASFAQEYWTGVFEPFVDDIAEGKMPNPDAVGCNSIVKFGAMREYALNRLGADLIATGHYARLWHRDHNAVDIGSNRYTMPSFIEDRIANLPERDWIANWGDDGEGRPSLSNLPSLLIAGADLGKDQSYFLSGVHGQAFRNIFFPLGDLEKSAGNKNNHSLEIASQGKANNKNERNIASREKCNHKSVREIATEANLPTAKKRESMGICFIGKRNFQSFISQYLPSVPQPGCFVDVDSGEFVGRHEGASHFTIGQGAKISGASRKWFIVGRSSHNCDGTVFVCGDTHHPALYSRELYVSDSDFNWIAGVMPPPLLNGVAIDALCRTRHLQPLVPCTVKWDQDNERFVVAFKCPIRAITPGQTAAVYIAGGLICLGGGQISSSGPSFHELGIELPPNLHPAGHNDLSVLKHPTT